MNVSDTFAVNSKSHCNRRIVKYVHYKYMSLMEVIRINHFRSILPVVNFAVCLL